MENKSLADIRREYAAGALHEADINPDPVEQFQRWMQEAITAQLPEPNAMILATADRSGRPCARVVLLKACDDRGFAFYTNYHSSKAQQLANNPYASLVFLWLELERQVRVEGVVSQTTRTESEAYFVSRPRESQLGALASRQSRVIACREALEQRYQQLAKQYPEGNIPMPDYWGGYRLKPDMLEFWQGRHDRMHDRLRYRPQQEGGWLLERLEP